MTSLIRVGDVETSFLTIHASTDLFLSIHDIRWDVADFVDNGRKSILISYKLSRYSPPDELAEDER